MADQDMRTYLNGLSAAGPSQTGDIVMVLRDVAGTLTWFKGAPGVFGYAPKKALVVDGVTRIRVYDPATDRGYNSLSTGIDNNIMQLPNYAVTAIDVDATYGEPFFLISRRSTAMVFINPQPGTNLAPGPENASPAAWANQAAMLAASAAVVGDCGYRTDTSTYWVLTTAGPSTLGHWTQLPAGAPGLMTIYNDTGLELVENGPEGRYTFIGPNKVVRS